MEELLALMDDEESDEEISDLSAPQIMETFESTWGRKTPAEEKRENPEAFSTQDEMAEQKALAVFHKSNGTAKRKNLETFSGQNVPERQTAVGNLAERLLEHGSGVRTAGNGGSVTLERRLSAEQLMPDRGVSQKMAAERLYEQVNTMWLRQSGGESRSVVVTMEDHMPVPALNLRDVDRVFQQDARRYDGGLHLL